MLLLSISWDICQVVITHLYCPPPVTHIYLIIDAGCAFSASIMALWGKYKILRELRITKEGPDAFYDIPGVKFKVFISDVKCPASEGRVPR